MRHPLSTAIPMRAAAPYRRLTDVPEVVPSNRPQRLRSTVRPCRPSWTCGADELPRYVAARLEVLAAVLAGARGDVAEWVLSTCEMACAGRLPVQPPLRASIARLVRHGGTHA